MYDVADVDFTFEFGFNLTVDILEDTLRENGFDPHNFDWNAASNAIRAIERNVMIALEEVGIHTRADGHNDLALVGSAYLRLNPPLGLAAIRLMEDYVNHDEPYRTGSGTLPGFIERSMFNEIMNEAVKRCVDVDLEFFDLKKLKIFLEFVEGGLFPEDAINRMNQVMGEAFLGAPEPSGVFKSLLGGHTTFSAKCPSCRRLHGNFRTFEEAAGNKMCRYCIRGFVDKIGKVRETGNFDSLLKKNHDKARH